MWDVSLSIHSSRITNIILNILYCTTYECIPAWHCTVSVMWLPT
jgi:hypothetical protein